MMKPNDYERAAPLIYRRNTPYFILVILGLFFILIGTIVTISLLVQGRFVIENTCTLVSTLASLAWTYKVQTDKPFLLHGNLWKKASFHLFFAVYNMVWFLVAMQGYETCNPRYTYLISVPINLVVYVLQVKWKAFRPYRIDRPAIMYVHPPGYAGRTASMESRPSWTYPQPPPPQQQQYSVPTQFIAPIVPVKS